MDLGLLLRVLWRFKVVVLTGLLIASALATVSYFRIDFDDGRVTQPRFTYRENEEWASYARLLVTQRGFQYGSSIVDLEVEGLDAAVESERLGLQTAAEGRLRSLSIFYAKLVESDAVRQIMRRSGPIRGEIEARPLPALEGSDEIVPIISIAGIASTAEGSIALTKRASAALREYIEDEQRANNIPTRDRILLATVQQAGGTQLLAPRPKTLPIVVFLTVLTIIVALAFVLENLRPRVRALAYRDGLADAGARAARRSASA
jgi:hypothetical protein